MRSPWVVTLVFATCLAGCPGQGTESPTAAVPPPQPAPPQRGLPAEVDPAGLEPQAPEPQAPEPQAPPTPEPAASAREAKDPASAETPADEPALSLLGDVANDLEIIDIDTDSLGSGGLDRAPLTKEQELARLRERAKVLDDEPAPTRRAERRPKRKRAPRSKKLRWLDNFASAQKESKRRRRPILAFFTGSDWCGWCKRLEGEVFNTKAFKAWAKRSVVLLVLDYPKKRALPPALQRQNQQLASRYEIKGFPTVLFLDAEGRVLGRSGYAKGGSDPWTRHADKYLTARR